MICACPESERHSAHVCVRTNETQAWSSFPTRLYLCLNAMEERRAPPSPALHHEEIVDPSPRDRNGRGDDYAAGVVDAAGNPRVCYSRIAPGAVNYELRYGTLDALGWTLETIPHSGGRALGPCVLAVDAAGRTLALTMYLVGAGLERISAQHANSHRVDARGRVESPVDCGRGVRARCLGARAHRSGEHPGGQRASLHRLSLTVADRVYTLPCVEGVRLKCPSCEG